MSDLGSYVYEQTYENLVQCNPFITHLIITQILDMTVILWLPDLHTMEFYNGQFPIIPLYNCPFITRFTYNTAHSYGHQIKHYKETALNLLQMQAVRAEISLHKCAVLSGPSLFQYILKAQAKHI